MLQDTKRKLQCPACGAEMIKVNIPNLGFAIDICINNCGGILFDNQELKKIIESKEDLGKIVSFMKTKNFLEVNTDKVRVCSVCSTPMVKMGGKNQKSIEYDKCNRCGAIFLDYGELENINFN